MTNAGAISKTDLEKHVREIYSDFDKRRKEYEALQADKDDIEELKQIENEKGRKNIIHNRSLVVSLVGSVLCFVGFSTFTTQETFQTAAKPCSLVAI